jgi:hypothetical protein
MNRDTIIVAAFVVVAACLGGCVALAMLAGRAGAYEVSVQDVTCMYTDTHEVTLTWTQRDLHYPTVVMIQRNGWFLTVGLADCQPPTKDGKNCSFVHDLLRLDKEPETARYLIVIDKWKDEQLNERYGPFTALRWVGIPIALGE